MSGKQKILLVDDHPIVRSGLVQMIEREDRLTVCGEAENAVDALSAIEEHNPDLVLVDITLGNANGLDLIKLIKSIHPKLPTLVLSMHDESMYAERALRAGAKGYVQKQESPNVIRGAIQQVLNGKMYVSSEIASSLLEKTYYADRQDAESPIDILSNRELEVFKYLGQGMKPLQISEKMNLSVKTVENYRKNMREKLNFKKASELTLFAVEWYRSESQ